MNEKQVLEHFDRIFGTDTINTIDLEDVKILKLLFEKLEERIYRKNPRYKKLSKQSLKLSEQLSKTFTEEQQELFTEINEMKNEMVGDENEQFFLFGYIVCEELRNECKIKKE